MVYVIVLQREEYMFSVVIAKLIEQRLSPYYTVLCFGLSQVEEHGYPYVDKVVVIVPQVLPVGQHPYVHRLQQLCEKFLYTPTCNLKSLTYIYS